jgi:protein-tyrosine phosphatase
MDVIQIDDGGLLFIGPDIDDWEPIEQHGITTIIDLDGELDIGVPFVPNEILYLYFPFDDRDLPDLAKLHAIAHLGAGLIRCDQRVLTHCKMGHNRSALLAGIILTYLGLSGEEAFHLLRLKQTTALYNSEFADYLRSLPACT